MDNCKLINKNSEWIFKLFIICCFYFFTNKFFSQNRQIDSLKLILAEIKEDTGKLKILNDLSVQYLNAGSYPLAFKHAYELKSIAEKYGLKKSIAVALNRIG